MPREDHPQQKIDKASEGENKQTTSAKVASEGVSDDPQAPRYEQKFTSFSSSNDKVTAHEDDPVARLVAQATAHHKAGSASHHISEFAVEDKDAGKVTTARGDRLMTGSQPAVRKSFMDGLKAVLSTAKTDEQSAELQSNFSIDYMLRKAKDLIGSAMDAFSPKSDSHSNTSDQVILYGSSSDAHPAHEAHISKGMMVTPRGLHDEITAPAQLSAVNTQVDVQPYAGEPALSGLNVLDGTHKIKPGETLRSIADQQLGKKANDTNSEAYVTEILHVNGLKSLKEAVPGRELVLPGHDGGSGAFIVTNGKMTTTTFPTGEQQFHNTNGRSFIRMPTGDGGYEEKHTGPGALDNFSMQRHPDGRCVVTDADGTTSEVKPSESVLAKHAELHEIAKAIPDPGARTKFEADMVRFEDRAHKRGLSDKEIIDTFDQVERILEAKSTKSPYWIRFQLAEEMMDHLADPRGISQGEHNTCNVTTVEALIYTKQPAMAAQFVADIALEGHFTGPDGAKVRLDAKDLAPHTQSFYNKDGERPYATQIFNVAAVNLIYQHEGGQFHYVQEEKGGKLSDPITGKPYVPKRDEDTGERLYDKAGHAIKMEPNLVDDQIVEVYQLISGDKRRGTFISHELFDSGKLIDVIKDEAGLRNVLSQQKPHFPIIIGVHTANEPFYTDSNAGTAGGSGGAHVVTITGFDEKTGQVQIDNEWDSRVDHRSNTVSIHQLYMAMLDPAQSVGEMEKDVIANISNSKIDTYTVLDYTRLQRRANEINNDIDFGWEIARCEDEANQRWAQQRKDGTFDQAEYDRAQAKLNQTEQNFTDGSRLAYEEGNRSPAQRAASRPAIEAKLKAWEAAKKSGTLVVGAVIHP